MNVFDNDNRYRDVAQFVREEISRYDSGHDWSHISRVLGTSLYIHEKEGAGDSSVIILGALMHDIGDRKFGTEKKYEEIRTLLEKMKFENSVIETVTDINRNISFSESDRVINKSIELMIVQDADRLDAIGAIGIARAFSYGGYKNRPMYIPDYKAIEPGDMSTYRKTTSPTINHFYEKLLLLKDMMNTETGRQLAEERHCFMLAFLEQFYKEWDMADLKL